MTPKSKRTSTASPTPTSAASPTPTSAASPTPTPTPPAGALTTFDQVKAAAEAYKAAHPGHGGKDWDINALTDAQLAADPAAQQLVAICGPDQRPVIPIIAWEYGGHDHQWINPTASALVYCVYIPQPTPTAHWQYDATTARVTADVYVLFPPENPCMALVGNQQVLGCLGDPTNIEILVDTASFRDGADAGLSLSNASTELWLILPDGSKVQLAFVP
jgi:hypothetical protein